MDSLELLDIVKIIESFIVKYNPSVVYTHHSGDVNIDHQIIHKAVVTACRPVPEKGIETLLFFEVSSSTEWQPPQSLQPFCPNWFVDITDVLQIKMSALNAYENEMRQFPHARSCKAIESLAVWRGATVGVGACEAFMLGRKIQ